MKYAIASYYAYLYAIKAEGVSGGNHKQEWLLAKALAARGHEVILIVASSEPLIADQIDGVRLVHCVEIHPTLLSILFTLRKEKPDWFHVMGASPNLWIESLAVHLFGIRFAFALAHDHHCDPHTALRRDKYLWRLYALALRSVDRILAQHSHQIDLLAPEYRSKAFVVNNIVEALENHGEKQPYISWVGWLRKLKRPHLIVEMAKALPHAQFVVCGPISDNADEVEYSQNVIDEFKRLPNIDYRGFVAREETHRIIAQSAALLSTAEGEGFPNTFLEAWIEGVPTISLEVDPGDIIKQYQTGIVVNSADELTDTLRELLSDPQRLQSLGESAYQYVSKFHSGEHVCQQLEHALGISSEL